MSSKLSWAPARSAYSGGNADVHVPLKMSIAVWLDGASVQKAASAVRTARRGRNC
jgi:hypothetical protein